MEKILLVEDDRDIAELERDYLELNGFAVDMDYISEICSDALNGLL